MEVPRTLFNTNPYYKSQPGSGRIVEAGDSDAAVLMHYAGEVISDEEATQYGVKAYLDEHPQAEAKAVEQASVEDKAVSPAETKAEEPEAEEETPPQPTVSPRGRRS